MATMENEPFRIGIDIGGTFTDFVIYDPSAQQIQTFKLLSTPHDPAEAVLKGLELIRAHSNQSSVISDQSLIINHSSLITVIHGSTVATNALLERKGARTALITTRGFRDVLQIGRQNRPALYDLFADPPPPLIPEELRFEVDERVAHTGEVLQPLDPAQVDSLIEELKAQNVQSVAICLLFSFLHPQHEQVIAERLRAADFLVSASSEIIPEYREYERTSTTAVNAYVSRRWSTLTPCACCATKSAAVREAQDSFAAAMASGGMFKCSRIARLPYSPNEGASLPTGCRAARPGKPAKM